MKADTSDIRNQPAYGAAEAARYLRLPAATLRTWLVGREYPKGEAHAKFHPLIKPASDQPLQLSFFNLIDIVLSKCEMRRIMMWRKRCRSGEDGRRRSRCTRGDDASTRAARGHVCDERESCAELAVE